jgi:hypothetical protein
MSSHNSPGSSLLLTDSALTALLRLSAFNTVERLTFDMLRIPVASVGKEGMIQLLTIALIIGNYGVDCLGQHGDRGHC